MKEATSAFLAMWVSTREVKVHHISQHAIVIYKIQLRDLELHEYVMYT